MGGGVSSGIARLALFAVLGAGIPVGGVSAGEGPAAASLESLSPPAAETRVSVEGSFQASPGRAEGRSGARRGPDAAARAAAGDPRRAVCVAETSAHPSAAPSGEETDLRASSFEAPVALEAPVSPEARLAIARRLAEDPRTHEEALDALLALALEPATTHRAHLALVRLARAADPRPGWLDVYAGLASDPRTTTIEADALRLRADQARTWVPDEHPRARDALRARWMATVGNHGAWAGAPTAAERDAAGAAVAVRAERDAARADATARAEREAAGAAVAAASAADPELAFHLARAHLVLGELDDADLLLAGLPATPRVERAARAAALARPGAAASLGDRVRAVGDLGYADLALRLAPRDDPGREDPSAWAAHALVLLARGRPDEARAALAPALARNPGDADLVEAHVRVLLADGDLDGARRAASGVVAAERRVRAVVLAAESPEEAYALAPDEPIVRRALAEVRLAAGRAEEAAVLLAPLVGEGPPDAALLERYAAAANAAGRVDEGLAAWRAAVTRASGPSERAALADALADALARAAEARKAAAAGGAAADAAFGSADGRGASGARVAAPPASRTVSSGARASGDGAASTGPAGAGGEAVAIYRVAVAVRPDSAATWAGLGGALWEAGARDAARDAYTFAVDTAPRHPAAPAWAASAADLALAAGRPAVAVAVATPFAARHPALAARVVIAEAALAGAPPPVAAVEALLAEHPADVDLVPLAARVLTDAGRADDALAAWASLVEQRPDDLSARLGAARALATAGRFEAALAMLAEAEARLARTGAARPGGTGARGRSVAGGPGAAGADDGPSGRPGGTGAPGGTAAEGTFAAGADDGRSARATGAAVAGHARRATDSSAAEANDAASVRAGGRAAADGRPADGRAADGRAADGRASDGSAADGRPADGRGEAEAGAAATGLRGGSGDGRAGGTGGRVPAARDARGAPGAAPSDAPVDPAARAAMARARADILRGRGDALWLREGRQEQALADYAASLAAAPDAWTWAAVGGLYLARGQAETALAAFRAGRALDATNPLVGVGEVRALAALGDVEGARAAAEGMPDPDGTLADEVRAVEDAARLGRARVLLALGEVDGARGALAPLRGRSPAPVGLAALLASIELAAGDAPAAWAAARGALREEPTDALAASVLVDAALEVGELDAAVALLEGLGGGPRRDPISSGGGEGRVAVEVALARLYAARGEGSRARARLAEAEALVDDPDGLALVGGGWLAVGEVESARVTWERALAARPDHGPSLAGLAATEAAHGRHARARALLGEAWTRTADPLVGATLADAHARAGALGAAVALRASLRGRAPASTRAVDPLPTIAALDTPRVHTAALDTAALDTAALDTAALDTAAGVGTGVPGEPVGPSADRSRHGERSVATGSSRGAALGAVSTAHAASTPDCEPALPTGGAASGAAAASRAYVVLARPTVDVGGAMLSRSGGVGTNQLFARLGAAQAAQPIGPVRIDAAALIVGLSDGERDVTGAAGALGVAAPDGAPLILRATLGSSPVGLSDTPYVTWHGAAGWRLGRGELGVDTGRAPVTDSLASWGGVDGWGRAASTWGGGWVSWTAEDTELGLRARIGSLHTLEMATGRRQLDLWAGHRLGAALRSVRLGVQGAFLGHDDAPDGFGPGASGAFVPPSYTAGSARVDGTWGFGQGAGVCGGLHLGAQQVGGDGSGFYGPGTSALAGVRAGGSMRLGGRWHAGVAARWDVVGEDWSEQAGLAWLRWSEEPAERIGAPSPVFGAAVESLAVCR